MGVDKYIWSQCSFHGNLLLMLLRIRRDLYKHYHILSKGYIHSYTKRLWNKEDTLYVDGENRLISSDSSRCACWWDRVQNQKIQDWDFVLPFMSWMTLGKTFNFSGILFLCLWIIVILVYWITVKSQWSNLYETALYTLKENLRIMSILAENLVQNLELKVFCSLVLKYLSSINTLLLLYFFKNSLLFKGLHESPFPPTTDLSTSTCF